MIISKKRFQEEVNKKVEERVKQIHENMWRNDRERERDRRISEMELRLIKVEKACGIDHPSHNANAVVGPCY